MKYQIVVGKDGAKRYCILFVDGIAHKTMWTGDTNGWVDYKGRCLSNLELDADGKVVVIHADENGEWKAGSYYDTTDPERIEEFLGQRALSHIRQTNDPHEINNMLRDLYGKQTEGYCHETNTITLNM